MIRDAFSLWQHVRGLEGKTLHTLKRRKPFDLVRVSNDSVLIYLHSTQKERRIPRKQIEAGYQHLRLHREINLATIDEKYAPRNPVYVAAMLTTLPGVLYSENPVTLRYQVPK